MPLSANCGCLHAPPISVSATLTLAPGCSPWRLANMATLQLAYSLSVAILRRGSPRWRLVTAPLATPNYVRLSVRPLSTKMITLYASQMANATTIAQAMAWSWSTAAVMPPPPPTAAAHQGPRSRDGG
jgi:hypothetical protein